VDTLDVLEQGEMLVYLVPLEPLVKPETNKP